MGAENYMPPGWEWNHGRLTRALIWFEWEFESLFVD